METQMDAFLEKVKGKYMTATLVSAKTGEILLYHPTTYL